MSSRDGGPAFPTEPNTQPGFYVHHGMSLRDYFAGQALAGLLACGPHDCEPDGIAHDAYLFADAMLAQRDKGGVS